MIRKNKELLHYIADLFHRNKSHISVEQHPINHKILTQDKRCKWVYIIKKGITKCYISDENGKDFIQEFLAEGMEFGELEVFTKNNSFCNIESITEVVIYKMSHAFFNSLLEKDYKFNNIIMKALAEKIAYKAPRHSFQQSYPIEDNLLRLKQDYSSLTEVISKKDISNYLGITIRSLNRAYKKLNW